ncbi:mannose-1-phosphate guanylyltransferase [Lewinella sp. 4G2]|uniref:mannose-1-phosphate guanylyltransferase n=1 Tax=Lewinella sp. 4G2 TaxID=1803372 RepID=UPI0007B4957C|nr:mannose-1-phosphate guanylyltransferase [Lewinella sp. 4G2]OAV45834.1 mannose-1-phosphate guanylyltransferase [Lewinella sp. 4G2]
MNEHTYVAIMAGGVGSRFWPASREVRPKQFLDITGDGRSLLRITFERFLKVTTADKIFIVTNAKYQAQVLEHLPELTDNQILCEPSRNNTAPCVAYTAFKLRAIDPDANIVIAPSDALILNEMLFADNINKALAFTAEKDVLVTLGIAPDRPHTGYGYIQFLGEEGDDGIYPVRRFTEKPDLTTAKSFLTSGDYLWNAGIFVWRAATVLNAYEQFAPEIYALLSQGTSCYNTADEQAFIDEFYPQTPSISVDYAIMENATNIYTIPAQFGWSDLGAWGALYHESPKDDDGNVIQASRSVTEDLHNCYVRGPEGKLIVVGGVDDLLVIDEGDVLLVYPRNREQEIKALRTRAEQEFGEDYV